MAAALGVGAAFSLAGFTARAAEPVPYQIITAPAGVYLANVFKSPAGPVVCYRGTNGRFANFQLATHRVTPVTVDCRWTVPSGNSLEKWSSPIQYSTMPYTPGGQGTFLDGFLRLADDDESCSTPPARFDYVDVKNGTRTDFYFQEKLAAPKPAPVSYTHCDEPPRRWDGPPTVAYQSVHFDIMSEQQQEQWERGLLSLEEGLVHLSAFPKPGEVIQFGKYWLITAAAVTNQFKTPTQGGQTVYDQIISPGRRYEAIASAIAGPHIQASSVSLPSRAP